MALDTYSDLKASLANWLHRADLEALIPDFIRLAEIQMNADVTSRSMETKVVLTATAGDANLDLPGDVLDIRRLQVLGSFNRVLIYRSADEVAQENPLSRSGVPEVFMVHGSSLELAPIPDSNYSIELLYYQRIPALSDANPTNWLLTICPNAYLYGALLAAQPYLINDERIPMIQSLYRQAVDGLNLVDWYSGSTMRVRAR